MLTIFQELIFVDKHRKREKENRFLVFMFSTKREISKFNVVVVQTKKATDINVVLQAPVVQTLDSDTHRINHYPANKYYGNQLRYPLDSDLSGG